ncbi:hypothetical protein GXN76_02305 [Kroppenstedtia pulmonis]|uniref:SPOR domain-containing protein n=1 Tax=Kroppenstedtia pulmonis TaxID=1380685 RepID=A0A7D3XHT1_9BACL|nr:hypothetical protein [Kroppenstedtia pulmonis]QKG83419.1 hypothetical protein GXN76_02305 [Kroppenstedtia pulmonis]
MLFHGGMVVIHQSFGTPRVIYSLRNRLERNLIHSELNVQRKKGIPTYQLLVPKKDARQARELLKHYKKELEQA